MRTFGILFCIAWLCTFIPIPKFETPAFQELPRDCVITNTWEDGSARAHCLGDYEHEFVFDPDGQTYFNTAGYPLRLPGFWYAKDI